MPRSIVPTMVLKLPEPRGTPFSMSVCEIYFSTEMLENSMQYVLGDE